MERLVTVEFGPSRSKRFAKALAKARSGAGECSELEPGRYRTRFVLGVPAASVVAGGSDAKAAAPIGCAASVTT